MKLMSGHANGKKLGFSQNRAVGSEAGCQSTSFTLRLLPIPEGFLGKRAAEDKERTEPFPQKTAGHHIPDKSQLWDTSHL